MGRENRCSLPMYERRFSSVDAEAFRDSPRVDLDVFMHTKRYKF